MALTKAEMAEHLFTKLGINKRVAKDLVESFLRRSARHWKTGNRSNCPASAILNFGTRISVPAVTQRPVRIFPFLPGAW